jgi:hypothetical protein
LNGGKNRNYILRSIGEKVSYCGDRESKKMERSGLKYLFGGTDVDFFGCIGVIVEGERGNKDHDRFSGLISKWMVIPHKEVVHFISEEDDKTCKVLSLKDSCVGSVVPNVPK